MSWLDTLVDYAAARLGEREFDALYSRGVTDTQIQRFKVGCLNNALPAGMPSEFERWARGKLDDVFLFPLTTPLGEVRGIQLRHIDRAKPGYMDYFADKSEACLFGLGQATGAMWSSRSVFLVEGVFDLFPIQRATPNVVATLTARVSQAMLRVLLRIVDRVWLGYDMDATGRKGCEEFQRRHGKDFRVYVVSYPDVESRGIKDPGDLWEAWGDAGLVPFIQGQIKSQLPMLR